MHAVQAAAQRIWQWPGQGPSFELVQLGELPRLHSFGVNWNQTLGTDLFY